jgi:hypothetical protein
LRSLLTLGRSGGRKLERLGGLWEGDTMATPQLRITAVNIRGMIELRCAKCGETLSYVPEDKTRLLKASEYMAHV